MSMTIELPDELYRRAAEIAAQANISVEELVISSVEQHLREFDRLKTRAERGNREKFLHVLDKVPDVEPADYDRL